MALKSEGQKTIESMKNKETKTDNQREERTMIRLTDKTGLNQLVAIRDN